MLAPTKPTTLFWDVLENGNGHAFSQKISAIRAHASRKSKIKQNDMTTQPQEHRVSQGNCADEKTCIMTERGKDRQKKQK
jgi:hypothetical protein